jgi:hypothetical protein
VRSLSVAAHGLSAKVRIVRGPMACATARTVVAGAYHAEATRHWAGYNSTYGVFWQLWGWRCYIGLAGSQTFCHGGAKQVDGSLRVDDGWTY